MPTLTTSGTPTANGDGTVTVDSTDRVQAPAALLDETQSWVAARIVIPNVDANLHHIFWWSDNANNYIRFYQGNTAQSGGWRLLRRNTAGAPAGDAIGITGTGGTDATIIGAWTATTMKVSVNGGAFVSAAGTNIPVLADTTLELLQADATSPLTTKCYWMAGGTGPITDADAAALHSYGNVEPVWGEVPTSTVLKFLWPADTFAYFDAAPASVPTAPQSLTAVPGDAQVALTWLVPASDGGSAITSYKIYRGLSAVGVPLLASPAGTNTAYTDFAVSNGVTYYYRVSAVNAVGETLSDVISTTPTAPFIPTPDLSTRVFKRLYGPTLLSNAAATLYTVPVSTSAAIRHVHVSNPSGSPVNFTMSIGTDTAGLRIWDATPIPAGDVLDHYQDFHLDDGEIIQAFAGSAAVLNLVVDGYEVSDSFAPAPSGAIYPGGGVYPSDFPAYPADDLFPH